MRDYYISNVVSLFELAKRSQELFGQEISSEAIKTWSADENWADQKRRHKTFCPHCQEDISDIVSPGHIDLKWMYEELIVRLFDEAMSGSKIDVNKVKEWRAMVKESGVRVEMDRSSAVSDLDMVLEKMRSNGS